MKDATASADRDVATARRANPLLEARSCGQSIWLDNLSRSLLRDGILQRLIEHDGITGVTSNPTILHKALTGDAWYSEDLAKLKATSLSAERRYEQLIFPDIQVACELLEPIYKASRGDDGYVSLELSPRIAGDAAAMVTEARRLWEAVDRRNLLVKVPATTAGLEAFEWLTAAGINVNVTLIFSPRQALATARTYIRGLEARFAKGGDIRSTKAVASLFLSRVDTLVDAQLEAIGGAGARALRGSTGIALAKLAYQDFQMLFHGPAFATLAAAGARAQYLLWASTGTKNSAYSDVLYVEPLIGPETINTLPEATLVAFRDHGRAEMTLERGLVEARTQFQALHVNGIDLDAAGETLQQEGLRAFIQAYVAVLEVVT